jgi:hypothetical protein
LLLQAKQWEEELAERRAQREFEANRLKEEAAERQAARELEAKRWESERAERIVFHEHQLKMHSRQLELMKKRNKVDKEEEMGHVMLLKKVGDVLRNTMVKMGDDVIELIPFCDSIVRHFKELKVPDELRVSLIKPFLNESARLQVNRLDAVHQNDYDYVIDQCSINSVWCRRTFLRLSIWFVVSRAIPISRLSLGYHCCLTIIWRVAMLKLLTS